MCDLLTGEGFLLRGWIAATEDLGWRSANRSWPTRRVGLAHHLAEITLDSDVRQNYPMAPGCQCRHVAVIKREEWRNGPSHALLRASRTFH
jgi:hypothetical protein